MEKFEQDWYSCFSECLVELTRNCLVLEFVWRFLIADSVSVVIGLFRFCIFFNDSVLVGWMFLEIYLLLSSISEKKMATHSSTLD